MRAAGLDFCAVCKEERSNSVTTVLMPGRDPKPLLDYCRAHCGVVVGVGIVAGVLVAYQRGRIDALTHQLSVQRKMESQLARFYDEMERMVVELDTIRGSLVSVSASTDAAIAN